MLECTPHTTNARQLNRVVQCLSSNSETNTVVGSVEDGVEVSEEVLAKDSIGNFIAAIIDPGVECASRDAEIGVLSLGNKVLSGRQRKGCAADGEDQIARRRSCILDESSG